MEKNFEIDNATLNNKFQEVSEFQKQEIQKLFDSYKNDLSSITFYSNKKTIKTINIPIKIEFIKKPNNLIVNVYCDNFIDSILLEASNIGIVNIRKEHRKIINNIYKTNFTNDQDLYIEPTGRLDIFYKKIIDIVENNN